MGKLTLANAALSVLRISGNSIYLTATGLCREDGERFVFLPIPLFLDPPAWGLFVECHEHSPRRAGNEFVYSQMIAYCMTAREIRIETQSGTKIVQIEKAPPGFRPYEGTADDEALLFEVFERHGSEGMVIARANAALPDVFRKLFGPAEQDMCERFIERKRGWARREQTAEPEELDATVRTARKVEKPASRM